MINREFYRLVVAQCHINKILSRSTSVPDIVVCWSFQTQEAARKNQLHKRINCLSLIGEHDTSASSRNP